MLDKSKNEMLRHIARHIAELPESGIVEVVNKGWGKPDLSRLWVGEGDLPTPDFIGEAAMAAFRKGETFYTHQRGIPPLRAALGKFLSDLYDVPVSSERIYVTVGGMQAVMQTVQMLIGAGDEAVVPTPTWPNIFHAVQITGGTTRMVPFRMGNDGWTLDLDQLFDACGPKTRLIYVNSPGNPTGAVMSMDDMIRLRDFARERDIWIVADEVYGRFTYDMPRAPSFLEIMEPEEKLIVIHTFSKNWAMSGWRIGWVVAPEALGQVFENLIQYNTSGVASFLQFGAVAAVEQGEDVFQSMLARCREGRDIVCRRLAEMPRVRFARPAGAFYLLFSVEGEPNARDLALRLVDEANVGLAPGTAFGIGAEEYLRLTYTASAAYLETAMDRLEAALS